MVLAIMLVLAPGSAWAADVAPPGAEAEHAADAAHGAPAATATDPLSFDPDLALATLIVFGILLAVLTKFAWGPISDALEARERAIAENIAAAERTNAEAKALLSDYERRLAVAHDEVRGILEEARRDAEHTKQAIVAEARGEAQAERERALRDIDIATDQALKTLAETSANLAVGLAGKIVRAKLDPAEHAQLVRESMSEFAQAKPSAN